MHKTQELYKIELWIQFNYNFLLQLGSKMRALHKKNSKFRELVDFFLDLPTFSNEDVIEKNQTFALNVDKLVMICYYLNSQFD